MVVTQSIASLSQGVHSTNMKPIMPQLCGQVPLYSADCSTQFFLPNCYHRFITLWSTLLGCFDIRMLESYTEICGLILKYGV